MKQIIMLIVFSWLSAQSVESAVQTMDTQYNDDALCAAALPNNKNGVNPYESEEAYLNSGSLGNEGLISFSTLFEMYPNPNGIGGQLNVRYKLPNESDGELIIYDMIGKLMYHTKLNPKANVVSFNLNSNLAQGTYQVVLKQQGKLLNVKKLNVLE